MTRQGEVMHGIRGGSGTDAAVRPVADTGGDDAGSTAGGAGDDKPGGRGRTVRRIVLVLLALVVLLVVGRQAGAYVADFVRWVDTLGPLAPVLFVAGYAVATVAFVPGSILTLAAGAVFGIVQGVAYVFVGAVLGSTAAFLVGRYVARDWVARRIRGDARFEALDRSIGRQGLKLVFLLRLTPVMPYNLLNYALGLTRVRLGHYVAAAVGMLPGTLLYVYSGRVAGDLATAVAGEPVVRGAGYWSVLGLGLVATVILTVWVTRMARAALRQEVGEEGEPGSSRLAGARPERPNPAGEAEALVAEANTTDQARGDTDESEHRGAQAALAMEAGSAEADARARIRLPPDDRHNRFLVDQVHPPDWINPAPAPRYDLVVVGGGSGGLVSSAIGAAVGGRVALVERHLLGGDCLNTGCVPSKAVLRAARAWAEARHARERFGGPDASGDGDFAAVMERMRRLRAEISPHDAAARFRDLGIDVFLGEGRFTGADRLEVDGAVLEFRRAVVATGGRPGVPPIPGLDEVDFLTSETVFELTERPDRLAVIGGGPIGCEFSQAMARLGCQVTLLEMEDRILPRDDADAAGVVARALEADGVRVRTGVRVTAVQHGPGGAGSSDGDADGDGEGAILVRFEGDADEGGNAGEEGDAVVRCDRILVAAGRRANVEGLGLEAAGVLFDRTGIQVDDRMRTTNRRIYAVGDVTGGPQLTHASDAQARIAVPNALFFGRSRASDLVIPWATYTSPEVAHVGISPDEVTRRGDEVDTVTVPLTEVDRARLEGEDEGFLRIHLAAGSDRILGATVVAEHAGELLAPVLVAMKGGVGLGAVSGTVFPYPTRSEVLRKAADQWRKRKLTPRVRRWMERVLRLLR